MMRYPIAKNGIFRTIQGEGNLLGVPMVFVRLAGCSIGCPQCDTDYRVRERLTASEILARVEAVRGKSSWIAITGGEPTDHDLSPLLEAMRLCGKVALATSGKSGIGGGGRIVDFLSVSPHGPPSDLVIVSASQINLVPGLNGLDLRDWTDFDASRFTYRYVTPLWYSPSDRAERISECTKFVDDHPEWRLGVQAHKVWGVD